LPIGRLLSAAPRVAREHVDTEPRLLMLIDDEPAQSRLITALAAREGWRTVVVRDSETAIAMLGTRQGMQLGAIILDQWVPGDDACGLIAELRNRRPACRS
jgi:DNA-binding response OmpR family regulator